MLVTFGWYILTGSRCFGRTGYTYFDFRGDRSPEFFLLVPGPEAIGLLVCTASYSCLIYLLFEKKSFAELLRLEEATISAYFVFIGHGYLQHGGRSW